MRTAILADIHSNREPFDAVMQSLSGQRIDRLVLLGDLVGYGPDPNYIVEQAARLQASGALCLLGNHDEAVCKDAAGMTDNARRAIAWTRARLSADETGFLRGLPLMQREGGVLFVHASAERPADWIYVRSQEAARRCLAATDARVVVCGHTHVPAVFYGRHGRAPIHYAPRSGKPVPISALHRHVVVVGSVGQPRDGNPAACYAILDSDDRSVTMVRVPYDLGRTARKIQEAGLPSWLGMRLALGR